MNICVHARITRASRPVASNALRISRCTRVEPITHVTPQSNQSRTSFPAVLGPIACIAPILAPPCPACTGYADTYADERMRGYARARGLVRMHKYSRACGDYTCISPRRIECIAHFARDPCRTNHAHHAAIEPFTHVVPRRPRTHRADSGSAVGWLARPRCAHG